VSDPDRLRKLAAFFFWTSWAASTNRTNQEITYTHNWPYEPLVGNRPTGETVVWTGVSIIMLLAGISAMVWWYAARKAEEDHSPLPEADPLGVGPPRCRRRRLSNIFGSSLHSSRADVVGVVTAHYGVEGTGLRLPAVRLAAYSVT
jgi:nitric oxide reductase subunit B